MILNNAENELHARLALIDIQKALNTRDHETLLDKMKCISASDRTIKIGSFLSHTQSFFRFIS